MNKKLEQFKTYVKGKSISVVGIGISNAPLIKMLVSMGANVTARDKNNAQYLGAIAQELEALGVTLVLGDKYLADMDDELIFKTPGMRFDTPELLAAKENGSVITSEMEVFFELCPAKIIAVTGSDGKTTTTTLIYKMLEASGKTCHLGGNIGAPLLPEIEKIDRDDIVVLELSSFQLHTMKKSPNVAVVTNLSPNHLDMHKSMEEYVDAKRNIYLHQSAEDTLIVNLDNDITSGFKSAGNTLYFSRNEKCKGVYCRDGVIYLSNDGKDTEIMKSSDILIPGDHNIENYMAAIAAVQDYADWDAVHNIAKTFGGVEHRCEFVREKDGVRYYNSSIDSSPNRTKKTISIFGKKVILIAGGKDKGIPYDDIGPVIAQNVKKLVLIGATSDKINQAVKNTGADIETVFCTTYPEAIAQAQSGAVPGDIVLLSPASTSFDMFRNFEERGRLFKSLVMEL